MDNLYKPIWDKEKTPLRIHLVDNPPLFAWVEKEYYDFTGNKNRIHEILNRKQYLQKHFDWFANAKAGERFECSPQNIHLNAIGEDGRGAPAEWTTRPEAGTQAATIRFYGLTPFPSKP